MTVYLRFDSLGNLDSSKTSPDDGWHEFDPATSTIDPLYLYLKDGQVCEYTEAQRAAKALRNSPHLAWSNELMRWVDQRTLADMKEAKNAAIDEARAAANSSFFVFQGRRIAVDAVSKGDIMGAHGEWLTGQAPEGWPGGWKSKDKGPAGEPLYVSVPDLATWLQFYRAMVAQGTANFNHSQALKAQLAAAQTPEEVDDVPNW